ncbi:MAG: succinate dehydrogenase cytochrome b558 subunit [Candidatus Koribacter versatilis]|uniref:Succinate dehydrogenase cytochrome b558 subunit n=1 Tax=Candidatus Korobacter versatilis TaxID=658062 RepID=A0A932EPG4_9BACT|nr:succinate dehydrogenase cytochrome b558 subunit [Candidatus Koribacter versatilis]
MASRVSPQPETHTIAAGVAPLRAGQGHSFLLRRLHSLSGIVPVGAFLVEHILVSNATAMNGPEAYANQVKFLASLPMVLFLEAFGIWLPILFHALYGFYIWYRGDGNTISYPWQGNWMYTLQRWTGLIAFAYIGWHVWHLRFAGIDLHAHPGASFGKVQSEFAVAWQLAFYVVGLLAASWHFAYGIWLFCAKWGITVGERARQRFLVVCMVIFFTISAVGLLSIRSFLTTPRQPADASAGELHAKPAPPTAPVDKK